MRPLGRIDIETGDHEVHGVVRPGGEGGLEPCGLTVGDIHSVENWIFGDELPVSGGQ